MTKKVKLLPGIAPHLKEFMKFLEAFNKESERGSVLIAMSMLDDLLGKIIRAFLVDTPEASKLLDGFNAPIGTLSARSLCAFALGLLSEEEYKECELLRKIRNDFAHQVHTSFSDPAIRSRCEHLRFSILDQDKTREGHSRSLFITSAVSFIMILTNRAHYAKQRRLKYAPWKI